MAIQILAATAGSRVIAVDADESRLISAGIIGADLALRNDETTVSRILDETRSYGVEVVLDFLGTQDTVDPSVMMDRVGRFALPLFRLRGLCQFCGWPTPQGPADLA
jgi:propanol-preferring alcohol dehydrogenase